MVTGRLSSSKPALQTIPKAQEVEGVRWPVCSDGLIGCINYVCEVSMCMCGGELGSRAFNMLRLNAVATRRMDAYTKKHWERAGDE